MEEIIKESKDSLGDRMKKQEISWRQFIEPRNYVAIRLDGKSFSKFTRAFNKPFDNRMVEAMNMAMKAVCEEVQGAIIGYVQSDEITVIFSDLSGPNAQMYFGGEVGKILTITASTATAEFNRVIKSFGLNLPNARFDSRIACVTDDYTEIANNLLWRQQDCIRNSVSMVGQSVYSHNQLFKKTTKQVKEMLIEKGINWELLTPDFKQGRMCTNIEFLKENVIRHKWQIDPSIHFLNNRDQLYSLLTLTNAETNISN